MLTYSQQGILTGPDGSEWGRGYSGYGAGKNSPADQNLPNVGPVPRGTWAIGAPYDSIHTGPFTLPLTPCEGTETFGRSEFKIHGDSIHDPGNASHGCIILERSVRERINAETDRTLTVV